MSLLVRLSPCLIVLFTACSLQQSSMTPKPETSHAQADPVAFPAPATLVRPAALGPVDELPSVADVVEDVQPWVASITVQSITRGLFYAFEGEGAGSGLVVRSDGYVATNYHVVRGANEIKVHLPNGNTYGARVVGRDQVTDLAILKIDAHDLPTAEFGDSDNLRVGDWVLTLGNALGFKGGPTVTLGIVSGLGRTIPTEQGVFYDLIQTDAAINEGNSGGPLVNLEGKVVGINQAILRRAQGVGFAVSSSVARPTIESLIDHGRIVRPRIGFDGDDVTPAIADELNLPVTEGVIVTIIPKAGPAYDAGIRAGDIVTKIDGIPTPDVAKWLKLLWSYKVGDQIQVEFLRNNEFFTATVTLAERRS